MNSKTEAKKSPNFFKWAFIVALIVIVALVVALWWFTRAINPVELTQQELAVVEEKITPVVDDLKNGNTPSTKSINITQRELNGYIHHTTDWGDKIQFELNPDEIVATLNIKIPKESPGLAGKKVRATLECEVTVVDNEPSIVITSITAFGTSYPEKFLQDYMNRNLIEDIKENFGIDYALGSIASIVVNEEELEILLY